MSNKKPLYLKIKEIIHERILTKQYPKGTLLPTEVSIAKEFDVSLVTVRQAIELLQEENYVLKTSGRGTVVLTNDIISKLSISRSFSKILENSDVKIVKKIISNKYINEKHAILNTKYTIIERCYYLNDKPYIYTIHYVRGKVAIDDSDSLYEYLYNQNYRFKQFQDCFSVAIEKTDANKVLEVNGPLLKRTRKTITSTEQIVEIAYSYYNTKLKEYQFNFNV